MEKYFTCGLFGVALALFCWRFSQSRDPIPAAITQDEVPDMPASLVFADAAQVVGMSYLPGPPVDVPTWRANIPFQRPAMGPPPIAAI